MLQKIKTEIEQEVEYLKNAAEQLQALNEELKEGVNNE